MAKLLFYTDSGYFSGAEIYFSHLVDAAAQAGHHVTVVVSPIFQPVTHPAWLKVRDSATIKIYYIATGNKLNLGYFFRLGRLLKSEQPQLIVCNMWSPFANTFALISAWLRRMPVMAIEHFYQEKRDITGPLRPIKLFAYAFKRAIVPYFVTVSNAHRQVLAKEFHFPLERIAILHPGVQLTPGQKPQNKVPQLVFLGTLEERKDPLFIINILAQLKELPWQLKFLGKGPLLEATRQKADELGIGKKVELLGWVNNGGEILAQSDILLHPARSENFSGVLIEAEAQAMAIVANAVGGNGEIVKDGVSGFLLQTGDTDGWVTAVGQLVTDQKLRQKMGQAGQAQYQATLTLDMMKKNFNELVQSYLGSNK